MKRFTLSLLFLLALGLSAQAQTAAFFTKADAFLKQHISRGLVDYSAIKANPAELNELVEMIAEFPAKSVGVNEGKAFWINAYNILVIKNVVDHMPLAKPTDVNGFFDATRFKAAGAMLTLSDIENKIIRPLYKDPRVHFALVCAGKGCPPIMDGAYLPSKLDAQLTAVTKAALNSGKFIRVDDSGKKVELSQILDWYKDDFLAEAASLVAYVNLYRTTAIPQNYKVGFYTYDWSLNIKK